MIKRYMQFSRYDIETKRNPIGDFKKFKYKISFLKSSNGTFMITNSYLNWCRTTWSTFLLDFCWWCVLLKNLLLNFDILQHYTTELYILDFEIVYMQVIWNRIFATEFTELSCQYWVYPTVDSGRSLGWGSFQW